MSSIFVLYLIKFSKNLTTRPKVKQIRFDDKSWGDALKRWLEEESAKKIDVKK
jgi:hypothetical protein